MGEWSGHRRFRDRERGDLYVNALRRFIAIESMDVTRPTAERYQRVLEHLLHYLDVVDVAEMLGQGPEILLTSERQFSRENAFFRIFGFDELVCCLPGFIEVGWLLPHPGDARSQVSLVGRLLKRLHRDRLIDMGVIACAYLEAEGAVADARHRLRDPQPPRPRLHVIRGGL